MNGPTTDRGDRTAEQSWVLVGRAAGGGWLARKRRRIGGTAASVETDWRWALARDERSGDVVGFLHTHPHGFVTAPSARDVRTMQAWCTALGRPLVCLIADGRQLDAYVFADDESPGVRARAWRVKLGKFFVAAPDSEAT